LGGKFIVDLFETLAVLGYSQFRFFMVVEKRWYDVFGVKPVAGFLISKICFSGYP